MPILRINATILLLEDGGGKLPHCICLHSLDTLFKRSILTSPGGISQESDSDNMTDEQMFKMDKLLAAVLRTQKEAKDKSKNTKQVCVFLKFSQF